MSSSSDSSEDSDKENSKSSGKRKRNANEKKNGGGIKDKKPPSPTEKSTSSTSSNSARKIAVSKVSSSAKGLSVGRIGSQPSTRSLALDDQRSSSTSQLARIDSNSSMSSVGLSGTGSGGPRMAAPDENALPKLMPEGDVPEGQSVYDCIVYLFYCPEHDRFAVSQTRDHCPVVWFPFVVKQPNMTNTQAAVDEMPLFLGRRDSEPDGEQTFAKMPAVSVNQFIHILHVVMPISGRSFHRFVYFVQIDHTEGYRCCEQTAQLKWLQTNDILEEQVEHLWGPEVRQFIYLIIKPEPVFMEEYCRENALFLLTNPDRASMYQSRMLSSCKCTSDRMLALFEDYLEHCFPATMMSCDSFRAYLIKHGFSRTDSRFLWLFNASAYERRNYLDFNEFLIGLLSMEPSTDHSEGRFHLLFRYYDVDRDNELSLEELLTLLRDANPESTSEQLAELLEQSKPLMSKETGRLTFETFNLAVQSGKFQGTDPLCRAPKPIISKVVQKIKQRYQNSSSEKVSNTTNPKESVKRKARGVCIGCRSQSMKFCLHTTHLDMDGLCQKPLRLQDIPPSQNTDIITPYRYSFEYVFSVESVFRMFIDQIRHIHQQVDRVGLMVEDASQFVDYLKFLTDKASDMLASEERLIRINAPAVVVGDILGNLDSLMAMERAIWQSVPILHQNLIFLGNYSGPSRFNVEVICYLLALKMLSPNKVFLLRGSNELREENKATLFLECEQRYGPEIGPQIWECLNEALDRLPMAVVVDESIFCVHSGVPTTKCALSKLYAIHKVIQKVQPDSPLACELIFNIPSPDNRSQSESLTEKNERTNAQHHPVQHKEFNVNTFSAFMRTNNLTHMIRSNDPRSSLANGYRLQYGTRLITISSAIDPPTVVFVDGTRESPSIRLVSLEPKPIEIQVLGTAAAGASPTTPTPMQEM